MVSSEHAKNFIANSKDPRRACKLNTGRRIIPRNFTPPPPLDEAIPATTKIIAISQRSIETPVAIIWCRGNETVHFVDQNGQVIGGATGCENDHDFDFVISTVQDTCRAHYDLITTALPNELKDYTVELLTGFADEAMKALKIFAMNAMPIHGPAD
jgi:hypothetical protein